MDKFESGKYNDNKERILELSREGLRGTQIKKILENEVGESFSKANVNKIIALYKGDSVETPKSKTSSVEYPTSTDTKPLSAFNDDKKLMDIDSYCEYYNLPREDVTSYKLVTHTGVPFYNLVFREKAEAALLDYKQIIKDVVDSIVVGVKPPIGVSIPQSMEVTRLVYTDTHIAMCTDSEGTAMYPTLWNEEALMETLSFMCEKVIENRVGNTLYIDDLGDVLDGWEGQTTRGGHKLPQNMSSPKAFEVALRFKLVMIETLKPYFDIIICHNVSVDNHAGFFAMTLNHAFKEVINTSCGSVVVHNLNQFMGHYYVGIHAFILCHGKDHKSLKFGFKPKLDTVQIEKIDHYLKHNSDGNIYKVADVIWFDKGDTHQMLFDFSTAQDFNYMNHLALSPASEWVQTNFKKGDRGFTIQQIDLNNKNIKILPIII